MVAGAVGRIRTGATVFAWKFDITTVSGDGAVQVAARAPLRVRFTILCTYFQRNLANHENSTLFWRRALARARPAVQVAAHHCPAETLDRCAGCCTHPSEFL